ncbi:hypothetical protein N431DRAFT_497409 [Stipitochalara longipes BDJ]|nr:hypothetical protein N431DRAFT_497409 [Stipitochalara longipes BDJ]
MKGKFPVTDLKELCLTGRGSYGLCWDASFSQSLNCIPPPPLQDISETTSTSVVAIDPGESSSPTGEVSPDQEYSKYDDPNYYDPKWGQDPPKVWPPYLQEFTIFPKLPIEILQHSTTRGYWSNVKVPVVLRVNQDSRNAVGFLYPLCFGSVLHQPRIVFNFSMDTLYFEHWMWTEVPQFLTSLKDAELSQIQSIAKVGEQLSFSRYSLTMFSSFFSMKESTWMMRMVNRSVRSCPILITCWKDSVWLRKVHFGDGSLLSFT